MYGIIISLLIVVLMMFFIIAKAYTAGIHTLYCKKSEIYDVLENVPDDCVIQILIGGNSYELKCAGNSRRRNL